MSKILIVMGEIFILAIIQSIIELFIKETENPHLVKVLTIACYAGGLYIVLKFVFDNIFDELLRMMHLFL